MDFEAASIPTSFMCNLKKVFAGHCSYQSYNDTLLFAFWFAITNSSTGTHCTVLGYHYISTTMAQQYKFLHKWQSCVHK